MPAVTPPPESSPAGPGRWQPQQRLAARAPVIATTPIVRTDHHHRTKDSTKIILAAIAATVIVVVAWLLVGGETADAPPVDRHVDHGRRHANVIRQSRPRRARAP